MGNRNSRRSRKFYWEQVGAIQTLLERYVKEQDASIDLEKYLRICEQLGQEPDPQKMPLDLSEFPEQVQVAFFIFDLLEDRWEGMSGSYLGKSWNTLGYFFDLYGVQDQKETLYIMKMYEGIVVKDRSQKAEQRRKAEERRNSASGGKKYTHNVKG